MRTRSLRDVSSLSTESSTASPSISPRRSRKDLDGARPPIEISFRNGNLVAVPVTGWFEWGVRGVDKEAVEGETVGTMGTDTGARHVSMADGPTERAREQWIWWKEDRAGDTPTASIALPVQRIRTAKMHNRQAVQRDPFLVRLCQADTSAMEGRAKLRPLNPSHGFIGTSHLVFHGSKFDSESTTSMLQTTQSALFTSYKP